MEKESSFPNVSSISEPAHVDLFSDETVDPVYQAKSHVLNQAIQEIGMGKYQWYLFAVAGFGWVADSGAFALVGNILYPVLAEYQFNPPLLSLALALGFFVGSLFWGLSSDIWGRRYVFNITLLIGGTFGIAAGGSNSFVALGILVAFVGMGVGGNVPVDSVVLLDFLPGTHQYLLTAANAFWSLGLIIANGIAWSLIPKHSCDTTTITAVCAKSQNMGWRYYCFTTGGLALFLWAVRFAMPLLESPRYLVGKGRNEEAVRVVHELAKINGKTSTLMVEQLLAVEYATKETASEEGVVPERRGTMGYVEVAVRHLKGLFATPRMALSTGLVFMITLLVGIALSLYYMFLPYIIASRGAEFGDPSLNITYRNQLIQTAIGIPASLLGGYLVEIPFLGRKRVLVIFTGEYFHDALSGVALLGSTTAKTSNHLLGWNIVYMFNASIGYGSMNAIGPETFHGQHRGTGTGLQYTCNRVAGIVGAIIALYANLTTAVPVYIAGAMTISGGLLALFFPYEPRGRSSI
ncbi:hypothetical protein M413DRAFT_29849 [Hebeloma cylindrosporum]|uniref:Major facilitator superfamily (MFS) profile domain-containing protein n=1 Tax=Hebeloma cylindrosporum TaxID=76867 RepID=A0A0C3C3T6_HEBCY|nr:hypothetical protein M413DRAFT_29849 [Hebeloma cylindrosporum h7]